MLADQTLTHDDWHNTVRTLLRRVRVDRGHSNLQKLELPGGLHWKVARRIEAGERENLFLRQVWVLCQHYDCSLVLLLGGSEGVVASRWAADTAPPEEIQRRVREHLRTWRLAAGYGYRKLAAAAGVQRWWITRVESGDVDQIDLLRLHRVLLVLRRSLAEAVAE